MTTRSTGSALDSLARWSSAIATATARASSRSADVTETAAAYWPRAKVTTSTDGAAIGRHEAVARARPAPIGRRRSSTTADGAAATCGHQALEPGLVSDGAGVGPVLEELDVDGLDVVGADPPLAAVAAHEAGVGEGLTSRRRLRCPRATASSKSTGPVLATWSSTRVYCEGALVDEHRAEVLERAGRRGRGSGCGRRARRSRAGSRRWPPAPAPTAHRGAGRAGAWTGAGAGGSIAVGRPGEAGSAWSGQRVAPM